MAEDVNSLTAAFSLGIQSAKGTQATKFNTALSTVSKGDVKFDTKQPLKEHPTSTGAISFEQATATTRTGYYGTAGNTFELRPKFIVQALLAAGMKVVTTAGPEAGTYKHTLTVETDALIKWMTAIHSIDDGNFERMFQDAHADSFKIDFSNERITCDLSIVSLLVGLPAGGETFTSEVDDEINPSVTGTLNFIWDGDSAALVDADNIRGLTYEITQTIDTSTANKPLQTSSRTDLKRKSFGFKGTIRNVNADAALYWKIMGNDTAATEPSLIPATGNLTTMFKSATNIGATATPYSIKHIVEKVEFTLDNEITAQNDDFVRTDITFTMLTNGTTVPLQIEVINDQPTYIA